MVFPDASLKRQQPPVASRCFTIASAKACAPPPRSSPPSLNPIYFLLQKLTFYSTARAVSVISDRMGMFMFVCRSSGVEWSAKQLSSDLEASASLTYELQRKLVHVALNADSSGGVNFSFSMVSPSSAVFQALGRKRRINVGCRRDFLISGEGFGSRCPSAPPR